MQAIAAMKRTSEDHRGRDFRREKLQVAREKGMKAAPGPVDATLIQPAVVGRGGLGASPRATSLILHAA